MTDKEKIIDGVDVSEWTDEEVRYKFEKHSPKAIRQIAFDLYKQFKRKEQECEQLKEELKECRIGIKDMSIESTEICKISEKYKRALDEIKKYLDTQQKYFDGEDYHNLLDIINKTKGEINEKS